MNNSSKAKYKAMPSPEWFAQNAPLRPYVLGLETGLYKTGDVHTAPKAKDIVMSVERDTIHFFKKGLYHREDGPAYVSGNNFESWYRNGRLHREDGPATLDKYKFYKNGEIDWQRVHQDLGLVKDDNYYRNLVRTSPRRKIVSSNYLLKAPTSSTSFSTLNLSFFRRSGVKRLDPGWYKTGDVTKYSHSDVCLFVGKWDSSSCEYCWSIGGYVHREDGPAYYANYDRGTHITISSEWYWRGYKLEVNTAEQYQEEVRKLQPHFDALKHEKPKKSPRRLKSSGHEAGSTADVPVYDKFDRVLVVVGGAGWGGGSGDTFGVFQPIVRFDSRNQKLQAAIVRSTIQFGDTFRVATITKSNAIFLSCFPGVDNTRSFFKAVEKTHSKKLANELRDSYKYGGEDDEDTDDEYEMQDVNYPGQYDIFGDE